MRVKQVKKVVESSNSLEVGKDCTFIRITKNWGLKLYSNEDLAKLGKERQERAHAVGLGPKVGGFVKIDERYGYFSEIIKPLRPTPRQLLEKSKEDEVSPGALMLEYDRAAQKKIDEAGGFKQLLKDYREHGIDIGDFGCLFNWGEKDGRVMLLDFAW